MGEMLAQVAEIHFAAWWDATARARLIGLLAPAAVAALLFHVDLPVGTPGETDARTDHTPRKAKQGEGAKERSTRAVYHV